MHKLLKISAVALLCGGVAGVALAQKPDDVIKYRQSVMTVIGWNFGQMAAMVKGEKPFDAGEFAERAQRVDAVISGVHEGFADGSETGETEALPDIWLDRENFDAKLQESRAAVQELATVTQGGDEAAIKAQFVQTGKTCKGCHDTYRQKKS